MNDDKTELSLRICCEGVTLRDAETSNGMRSKIVLSV